MKPTSFAPARFALVSAGFAVMSLAVVLGLLGGAPAPQPTEPRLAQAGAEIAAWLIGLVVVLLIGGAVFLFLGRRKKKG